MRSSILSSGLRLRAAFCVGLIAVATSTNAAPVAGTRAYFGASAATTPSTISTVTLRVAGSPSVSGVFDIASNMLPGDFAIKTLDVQNGGTSGATQQDFTYSLVSSSTGGGDQCSLLDSADPPTCSIPAGPSASASTGAALLLLRCTSDSAGTTPLACSTPGVYVTQVYPFAGAGTQQQLSAAGGLSRSAIAGVATGGSYGIAVGGTNFTGGPVLIGSAFGIGGPDSVSGADGQTHGLAAGRTDHLASIVYLPSQAGDALANQASVLTFTWTATQRLGSTRS